MIYAYIGFVIGCFTCSVAIAFALLKRKNIVAAVGLWIVTSVLVGILLWPYAKSYWLTKAYSDDLREAVLREGVASLELPPDIRVSATRYQVVESLPGRWIVFVEVKYEYEGEAAADGMLCTQNKTSPSKVRCDTVYGSRGSSCDNDVWPPMRRF